MPAFDLRVGLAQKIFGVGAIGVAGLLLIAAINFLGAQSVERYQKLADEAGGAGALPNKVMVQLLELRRAEKDFLLRNDVAYVKRHNELSRAIRDSFAPLKRQFSADGQTGLIKTIDALSAGFDVYVGHFATLSEAKTKLGLNENSGLEGALRASVHGIETLLKEFNDAPANAAMLTLRRHEKDFMLRRDAKYGEQMKSAARSFEDIIERSAIPFDAREDIAKKLAAYQRDFFAYMAGAQTVAREQKAMSDAYAKIEPEIAALTQAADQVAEQARQAATDERAKMASRMQIAMIAVILGVCVLAFLVARGITRPINGLVGELKKLAAGDFNVSLQWRRRKDEIGEISKAVDLLVDRVGSTVAGIKTAAGEVTSASAEISTATMDLSQRSEEQAASLEEAAASLEEMTATVKKNADNAQQASALAASARAVADRGGEVVAQTVTAMVRIEESSRKITDIISVIDEVARQTNLLALNAAVEAARAGEAGRGFAVVASEVRNLAQRSSQAAKDISALITSSAAQVKDGVDLANSSGEALKEIVQSIRKVTDVVADIAHASAEQSAGLEQINKALSQLDEITQQNSALVEENAATAKTLENQARSMDERTAYFRLRAEGGEAEPVPQPPAERQQASAPGTRPQQSSKTADAFGEAAVAAA